MFVFAVIVLTAAQVYSRVLSSGLNLLLINIELNDTGFEREIISSSVSVAVIRLIIISLFHLGMSQWCVCVGRLRSTKLRRTSLIGSESFRMADVHVPHSSYYHIYPLDMLIFTAVNQSKVRSLHKDALTRNVSDEHCSVCHSGREDSHQMDSTGGYFLQEVHFSQRRLELRNCHVGGDVIR